MEYIQWCYYRQPLFLLADIEGISCNAPEAMGVNQLYHPIAMVMCKLANQCRECFESSCVFLSASNAGRFSTPSSSSSGYVNSSGGKERQEDYPTSAAHICTRCRTVFLSSFPRNVDCRPWWWERHFRSEGGQNWWQHHLWHCDIYDSSITIVQISREMAWT